MEQDQRLTPLPRVTDIQANQSDYPASYNGFYEDESMASRRSIKQYYNVVYTRLPLVLAIAVIVTAAAAFYSFRLPSIFQATTGLIIEPRSKPVTQKDAININFGGDQNYYNTQLLLLQSPELMKKVVLALNLHHEANLFGEENKGIMASIRSMFGGEQKSVTDNSLPVVNELAPKQEGEQKLQLTPEEDARAKKYASNLLDGVKVDQTEGTSLVSIRVQTQNQQLAPKFSDKIAEIFIDENAKRELEGSQNAYDELSKSIDELRATIGQQENKLTDYMRSSNLPLADKGVDLAATRLQTISSQWLTASDDRRKLEARYNAAVSASARGEGKNIPDLFENKVYQDTVRLNTERRAKLQDQIRDIDKQISLAETEKAELLVKYTPEYSRVKQIEERISTLTRDRSQTETEVTQTIDRDQKKIDKDAVSGALVGLRSQLEAAVRRENQLLGAYEQESATANTQGQAATTLTTLKRELETNRGLLDTYTQRQKEQELAITGGRPNNIKVSSRATGAALIGPNRLRNIIVALLASLAMGIGLAFLLDYLDDSVRTSEDVGRHLGLPTLALIPHHDFGKSPTASLTLRNENVASPGISLITLDEKTSPIAEAYRHLRTSLLFSSAGKPPQTILVTSSQPSEGKTTTAINTAITLAQGDADVIVIDCDLRRPRLHNHFGLTNTHGLTNYLSGEKSTENLIKSFSDLPRLKIITSGPIPPNPAELLSSAEMRNLLQFLRGRYKHVIIDSPPALSFTDAAILSTLVDGVVLVAMAGKSSIHLMRQFKSRLSTIGARIYGVVINGVKAGSMDYDYYGSGYYDYYHKASSDDSTPMMEDVTAKANGDQPLT